MDAKNSELKIDLNINNSPRETFPMEKPNILLPEKTLGYSFDMDNNLGYMKTSAPLLYGFNAAHDFHYPIRIRPDDIWLLIVQSFSNHVNENSEDLRKMFVNFDGKKELIVKYNISTIDEVDKKILENFSEQINEQLKTYLGEELVNILTPNYSTTTYDNLITCKLSIMCAFKKYFDYKMSLCGCGIPYLILEGTAEDYSKILEKAKFLSKYKFDWYIERIIPLIQKMVEAKQGKVDVDFFKNIVQDKKMEEYVAGPSGIGGHTNVVDGISGWILKFFAYIDYGHGNYTKFGGEEIKIKDLKKLPSQMLIVPFKIVDIKQTVYNMKYQVGFAGCGKNEKNEIYPVSGWIVSPMQPGDDEDERKKHRFCY